MKPGLDDLGVVEDQQVTRVEQAGQLAKTAVRGRPVAPVEQARAAALRQRVLGNQLRRQRVIKVGKRVVHAPGLSRLEGPTDAPHPVDQDLGARLQVGLAVGIDRHDIDRIEHRQARDDAAEHRIAAPRRRVVQRGVVGDVDEPLRGGAVRVAAARHRDRAAQVRQAVVVLELDRRAGGLLDHAAREAAALDDEVLIDAMHDGVGVEVRAHVVQEVRHGDRRIAVVELEDHLAAGGQHADHRPGALRGGGQAGRAAVLRGRVGHRVGHRARGRGRGIPATVASTAAAGGEQGKQAGGGKGAEIHDGQGDDSGPATPARNAALTRARTRCCR